MLHRRPGRPFDVTRMFQRHRNEGHLVNRVGPRGKDFQAGSSSWHCRPVSYGDGKVKGIPFRLADPLPLPLQHRARPTRCERFRVQPVQQLLRIPGRRKEPLVHQPMLNQRARPPATPFCINLFVGQHCLVHRVPLHPALLAVGKALLEQHAKQLLRRTIVRGVRRDVRLQWLSHVCVAETNSLHLRHKRRNVVARPRGWIDAVLLRRRLGRQAKRVKPPGIKKTLAAVSLASFPRNVESGYCICDSVASYMASV
mmetsp:Transcript_7752/g.24865  ORF Transcript_7752/g.24865 Transcript_7752/m.24865 type:complete len:255 (+) Transcript_7752:489-1253(+)